MDVLSNMKDGVKTFFGYKKPKRASVDKMSSNLDFQPANLQRDISIKEYIKSDADLAANLRRLVDNILLNNPILSVKDGKNVSPNTVMGYKEKLEDARFYKKLRSGLYSLIWSGNAFYEIERDSKGGFKNLYFMDSEYIKFIKNDHGEVVGYSQEVPNNKVIKFKKEDVVHITIDHLDSGASGESFAGALQDALARKDVAESYLEWMIANNKLNKFWTVTGDLSEEDIAATIQSLRFTSRNPNLTSVIHLNEGVEIDFRRYFDTEDFDAIMKYIDEQKMAILSILQVPPIIGGNVDASNRSNSEVQARFVFYNTIRNFQKLLVDELNQELLKTVGWKNVEFKFPHTDRATQMEIFKVATSMQGLNFTNEVILGYLKNEGFEIPNVDEIFNPKPEFGDGMDETGRNPADPTPSREPRDKTGIPQNEAKKKDEQKVGVALDERQ